MNRIALLLVLVQLAAGHRLWGQERASEAWPYQNYPTGPITVPSWRYAHGPHVRAAFRSVVSQTRESTVEIHVDGHRKSLGGIVDSRGWVLTKASPLGGQIICAFSDGRESAVAEIKRNSEFDLALLKIDGRGVVPLQIGAKNQAAVGSWVATVGIDSYPVGVGVVSVEPRKVAHQAGVLGVALDPDNPTAKIILVFPGSAASRAGLLTNDVLLSIDGEPTETREDLIEQVRRYNPGDEVRLEVRRADSELVLTATLMGRKPGQLPSRAEFQNSLGGDLSERRFGFPSAFQHDTVIEPEDCGGPLVNLAGEVVGFNLARAGRTETYAIGAAELAQVLAEMLPVEHEETTVGEEAREKNSEEKLPALANPLVPAVPAEVP